jgi:hypothetical protein
MKLSAEDRNIGQNGREGRKKGTKKQKAEDRQGEKLNVM